MLVIASGARESYFGHDDWAAATLCLKKIDDATTMRRRILVAFERAEDSDDEAERRRLLTFVIVGGGPTGVELAGALAELPKAALASDFRRIDPTTARIVLVEAGPRLLPSFPPMLSAVAARALTRLGVELRLGDKVTSCDGEGAVLGDERLESRTVIWAAGVAASPAATWLGIAPGRGDRIPVMSDLSLPEHPEIFVIGDTAQVGGPDGQSLPSVAPVAEQEGAYVARVIAARIAVQRLGVQHKLPALGLGRRRRDRHLAAKFVRRPCFTLADAFDLGRVQRINLRAALTVILKPHSHRQREQVGKALGERRVASNLAANVTDRPAQSGAQEFEFAPRPLELVGVAVAPDHDRGALGDPRFATASPNADDPPSLAMIRPKTGNQNRQKNRP